MRIIRRLLVIAIALLSFALVSCNDEIKDGDTITVSITEKEFEAKKIDNEADYYKVIYVAPTGSDENSGTYDKPLKTLDGARAKATSLSESMDKDICVVFREGTYKNSKTTFTGEDSGKNGHKIIYRGYPGEEAVISGGIRVNKWTKDGDLYYASVKASSIRELFINGEKATLARNPNGVDYTQLVNWDTSKELAVAQTEDLKGATSFEAVFYMEWNESIARVKSVTKTSDGMKMNFKTAEADIFFSRSYCTPPQGIPNMYVYYQNAMEFLDNPGEFFYDSSEQRLYYYPRECDDMRTAEVIIPVAETIVTIQGNLKNYVENIEFENLTFAHNSDYTVYRQGFSEIQAAHYYDYSHNVFTKLCEVIGASVEMNFAKNINISNSTFTATSSGGLLFDTYCQDCNVLGNLFYKTGAYGIMVSADCSAQFNRSIFQMTDSSTICHDILIKNNYFFYTGTTFTRSPAITNIHGYNITISHNEVGYASYTGISCGWGWSLIEYHAKNNVIEYNDIHHYGMFGSDLGGIYTLNNQPNTVITGNYIHEAANTMMAYSPQSCYNPIYLDEGSNNMVVSYNQIAYCGESYNVVLHHITGNNITEIDNCGLEYGHRLDQDVINNAGVEDGQNSLYPFVINNETVTSKYTLFGKKESNKTDLYGYRFEVTEPITIKALGRAYGIGNYQKHTIYIYDADKKVIASATVDMSKGMPDQYGYKYQALDKPITLPAGKYYIVSQEYAGGDWYMMEASRVVSDKVSVIGIVRTSKLNTVKSANFAFVGLNMILENK